MGGNESFTFPVTIDSGALSVAPVGYVVYFVYDRCVRSNAHLHLLHSGFFFKGAAFGVYNTGNGKPSLSPAHFAFWKQTPGQ